MQINESTVYNVHTSYAQIYLSTVRLCNTFVWKHPLLIQLVWWCSKGTSTHPHTHTPHIITFTRGTNESNSAHSIVQLNQFRIAQTIYESSMGRWTRGNIFRRILLLLSLPKHLNKLGYSIGTFKGCNLVLLSLR